MSKNDKQNGTEERPALCRIREAATEFAFEFFKSFMIRHEAKYPNLFYSPFLVYSSMATLLVGANGKTKTELAKMLRVPENDPEILKELCILEDTLMTANRHYIYYGNYFYIDSSVQCTSEFIEVLRHQFGLKPQIVDFKRKEPEEIAAIINKDIVKATENAVDEVINADLIHSSTMFLIANAALFRGHWERMFQTVDKSGNIKFTVIDTYGSKTTVPVTMMTVTGHYKHCYSEKHNCKMVHMPYESSDLAMIYILPDEPMTAINLMKKFDRKSFIEMLGSMKKILMQISIPKFALDPNDLRIRGTMKVMGAETLFKKNQAQLQGISPTPGLYLERVAHKAFIIVDDKGTRMSHESIDSVQKLKEQVKLPTFDANHAFAFFVIDEKTNVIVFMGFFGDPRQTLEVYTEQDLSEAEIQELLKSINQI